MWSRNAVLFHFVVAMLVVTSESGRKSESVTDEEFCTINTTDGQLRGKLDRTVFDDVSYYSFRGIPFGKPPIGHLRFKAPQKSNPWNGTLDALDFGNDCMQFSFYGQPQIFGSEDCLYLNVYVPAKCSAMNPATKLPVMVFIFGGRFVFGTPSFYKHDFFMETNVIIVTVNVRVDILGYLSLNTPEYSGNMGIKDNVLALRWINENIERFGGDQNRITLFGHSSGASLIHLMAISPQGKNLFQKAVMMSGSALCSVVLGNNDHFPIISYLAEKMYYPVFNKEDAIEFLNQVDIEKLLKSSLQDPDVVAGLGRKRAARMFSPCIEDKNAIDPFITESPFETFSNPNFQINIDSLFSDSPFETFLGEEEKNSKLLENFDKMIEITLPLTVPNLDWRSDVYKNIANRIRAFYFNGQHVNRQTLRQMNDLWSDARVAYGVDLSARIQAVKSIGRTIYARFSAMNDFSFGSREAKKLNITLYRTHMDVLFYIFRLHWAFHSDEDYLNISEQSLERQIIKRYTNFLANFAKNSNPMPEIDPVYFLNPNTNHLYYYDLTNDGISIETDPNRDRMQFWNDVFNDNKHLLNTNFDFRIGHNMNHAVIPDSIQIICDSDRGRRIFFICLINLFCYVFFFDNPKFHIFQLTLQFLSLVYVVI